MENAKTKNKMVVVTVELQVPINFEKESLNGIIYSAIREGFRDTIADPRYIAVEHIGTREHRGQRK